MLHCFWLRCKFCLNSTLKLSLCSCNCFKFDFECVQFRQRSSVQLWPSGLLPERHLQGRRISQCHATTITRQPGRQLTHIYLSSSLWVQFDYFQNVMLQIGFKNMEGVQHVPLTQEKAVQLVTDVFISAAERDVYTGDALRICVVTKEGIKEQTLPLRKDWRGEMLPTWVSLFIIRSANLTSFTSSFSA